MFKKQPIPFQWQDDDSQTRFGEGISRARDGARTREYRLIVYRKGSCPMTWIMRAENKKAAISYAEARWPGATVEVA